MTLYAIRHRTTYRYDAPVRLGPHRLLLRPRDSHDLDLLETGLTILPEPATVRWLHDVHSNSIAIAEFDRETRELVIESRLKVDHRGLDAPQLPLEWYATTWPFFYDHAEWPDLRAYVERQHPDLQGRLHRWARRFVKDRDEIPTQELLVAIMAAIHAEVPYRARYEPGVQDPLTTLDTGGTCRDFALLMIEAVRSLGLAARFVSGYLYVPAADPGSGSGLVGGGATHAWVQVYLPGAGWVEFDPTNALYGGVHLFRVAIARDPAAALPITGSFTGPSGVTSELEVEVVVDRL